MNDVELNEIRVRVRAAVSAKQGAEAMFGSLDGISFLEIFDHAALLLKEVDRLHAENDAIVRLCYHSTEASDGQWFYRLKVDPIDGGEMECDYDTEDEAKAAVRMAAGLESKQ